MKDCHSACGSIQRLSIPGSSHGWICQPCNNDPAQTPELYNVRFLVKKSIIMDQTEKDSARLRSYAVETQGEGTTDFKQVFPDAYAREYAEDLAAVKQWQKGSIATFEECRRRGRFLDDGSDGGDGRARYGSPGRLVPIASRTRLRGKCQRTRAEVCKVLALLELCGAYASLLAGWIRKA